MFPGIRYTGRLAGDPLGQMTLGEGTIINGTGVQRTTNSRWGDYTSLNVDPTDDCTFWYVNEYYTLAGQLSSTAGWQTRIAQLQAAGLLAAAVAAAIASASGAPGGHTRPRPCGRGPVPPQARRPVTGRLDRRPGISPAGP